MFDPTDPYTKEIIAQRIAQFEADMAADREGILELVSELEAEAAEQARLAAVDARIEELEANIEAEEAEALAADEDAPTERQWGTVGMEASAIPPGCSSRFVETGGVDEFGCPLGDMVAGDE
jgi:hypothetical protein